MSTPALLAKGALRRLAQGQLEPTPENFARAYAQEAGTAGSAASAAPALPERARPLLSRLAARVFDDTAGRAQWLAALMQGDWALAERTLDTALATDGERAQAWPALMERLARGLERGAREWTAARKKSSLQHVLSSSRSDARRLQQRLQVLLTAWENDTPAVEAQALDDSAAPPAAADTAALAAVAPEAPEVSAAAAPIAPAPPAPPWPAATAPLARTLCSALPPTDPRTAALADELGRLADRLAAEGPAAATVQAIEDACVRAQRLLAHRHHLFDAVGHLCDELSAGLTELSEDESWARGQCHSLQASLADGLSARSVRAAATLLAETRQRQAQVRAERQQASQALKGLIQRLLGELGELGAQTGRFEESVARHADAIERAESLEGLASVVRELVDDSRAVHSLVHQTQQRLQHDHARASELEARVRELESELRRVSDEVATDALTQVANRRGLQQAFEAECARAERAAGGEEATRAVGLIDIDNFKKLNDSLGHTAGDVALKSLAAAVRDRLRPVDTVARFGGEEFVLLLPGTPAPEARQAVTRLQRDLSASLFMHDGRDVFVTFSAGVTAWRPGEALERALERADEALYEAKRSGKNRTCLA